MDKKTPLELSNTEKKEVTKDVYSFSKGNLTYYLLIILSAIIATLGLVLDNTPIVIGSMLIAPFMGPMLATSLSLVRGDLTKFQYHFKHALLGIGLAVTISAFLNFLLPINTLTEEIISRTNPTLLDLIVALAAGAVAALSVSKDNVSESIGGVAIAVAVLPPLAVLGFGIANGLTEVVVGSSLLFISNFVAIIFMGAVIFLLFQLQTKSDEKSIYQKSGLALSAFLLIIIAIPLTGFLLNSIKNENMDSMMRVEVIQELAAISPEIEIVSIKSNYLTDPTSIELLVRAPQDISITPENKKGVQLALSSILGSEPNLRMSISPYIPDGKFDRVQKLEEKLEKIEQDNVKLLEYLSEISKSIGTIIFGF